MLFHQRLSTVGVPDISPVAVSKARPVGRSGDTGIISGIPTETSPMTNYTVFANNSQTGVMFNFSMAVLADTDDDGLPDGPSVTGLEVDDDDDGDGLLDELEVKCGSSPSDSNDVAKVDENGECIVEDSSSDKDDDSGFSYWLCCLPLLLLLLLLLFLSKLRLCSSVLWLSVIIIFLSTAEEE